MTPGAQSTLGPTDRWGALSAGMGGPWRVGTQRQLLRSRCQLLLITQPVGSTSTGGSLGPARGPRCQAPARSQEPLASATGRAAHVGSSLPGRAPARRRSAWWNARFVRTPAVHLAGAPAPQGRCRAAQGNPEAPPSRGWRALCLLPTPTLPVICPRPQGRMAQCSSPRIKSFFNLSNYAEEPADRKGESFDSIMWELA